MNRHRFALAAAVVALPFALTACSSGGTTGASGHTTVALNPPTAVGAPSSAPAAQGSSAPAAQGSSTPGAQDSSSAVAQDPSSPAAQDPSSPIASSAFCQALAKSSDDAATLSSGESGDVTEETLQHDAEDALAKAPAAVKGDMQIIVAAGRAAEANGTDPNADSDSDSDPSAPDNPQADAAEDRMVSWANSNCSFH